MCYIYTYESQRLSQRVWIESPFCLTAPHRTPTPFVAMSRHAANVRKLLVDLHLGDTVDGYTVLENANVTMDVLECQQETSLDLAMDTYMDLCMVDFYVGF